MNSIGLHSNLQTKFINLNISAVCLKMKGSNELGAGDQCGVEVKMKSSKEIGGGDQCGQEPVVTKVQDQCEVFWSKIEQLHWLPGFIYSFFVSFFIGPNDIDTKQPYNWNSSHHYGVKHYLRTIREKLASIQEKRGVTLEENTFMGVIIAMVCHAGQAMYAVITMFLALLPAVTILLHIAHFLVDRLIDALSTRNGHDITLKCILLFLQLIFIYFISKFLLTAIFIPIFSMQLTIITKLFLSVLLIN